MSAVSAALEKGCTVAAVTSGGKLERLAKKHNLYIYKLPGGYPPRSALGFSLGVLMSLFERTVCSREEFENICGFLDSYAEKWSSTEEEINTALQAALQVAGNLPLIYSSTDTAAAGMRWKAQFNENSKTHAFFSPLPEMNHNEIVGWTALDSTETFYKNLHMIILRTEDDDSRMHLRMDTMKKIAADTGRPVLDIRAEGVSRIARILYLVFLGDMASFYLAVLYGADPTAIENIDTLKEILTEN